MSQRTEEPLSLCAKGFKYAFYTLIAYFLSISLLLWSGVDLRAEASLLMLFGVLAGGIIFATVTVLNDAYFRAYENKTKYIIFLVFIFLFNIMVGISQIVNNKCLNDGVLTFNGCANLMCGAGILYVLILFIVKSIIDRKEGANEES